MSWCGGGIETRVLDSRPKLLDFHMPGLALASPLPNKGGLVKAEEGDYCMAWGTPWEEAEEALSSSSAVFEIQTRAIDR
jgi:hypothetical protein